MIFQYVLEDYRPVTLKECCTPTSTSRSLSLCRKHGAGTRTDTGRFAVLLLSSEIREEASWVLYNQCRLRLLIHRATKPYFPGRKLNSVHRLASLPLSSPARATWTALAKFRFIDIEVPARELVEGHPVGYTAQMLEAAALLLKTWSKTSSASSRPKTVVPHQVTIHLGTLFNEIVPFNGDLMPDSFGDIFLWLLIHYPDVRLDAVDFDGICQDSGRNLQKLIKVIGKNKGATEWSINAVTDLEEEMSGGRKWLSALESSCAKEGLGFRGVSEGDAAL